MIQLAWYLFFVIMLFTDEDSIPCKGGHPGQLNVVIIENIYDCTCGNRFSILANISTKKNTC